MKNLAFFHIFLSSLVLILILFLVPLHSHSQIVQTSPTGVVPHTNLGSGSTGSSVVELQNFLISQGFSIPAGATGNYLDQTTQSVKDVQDLLVNTGYLTYDQIGNGYGWWGPLTQGAYERYLNNPSTAYNYFNSSPDSNTSLPNTPTFNPTNNMSAYPPGVNPAISPNINGNSVGGQTSNTSSGSNINSVPGNNGSSNCNRSTTGGIPYTVWVTSYTPNDDGGSPDSRAKFTNERLGPYLVDSYPTGCKIGMAAIDPNFITPGSLIDLNIGNNHYYYKAGDGGSAVTYRNSSVANNQKNQPFPQSVPAYSQCKLGNRCLYLPILDIYRNSEIEPYRAQIYVYPAGSI